MTWNDAEGVIRYGPGIRAIVEVDQGIADFYRSLLPKWIKTTRQRYGAHISFVRHETPPKMEEWNRYEGVVVPYRYSNIIYNDETYYWIHAESGELERIRMELGLPRNRIGRDWFHITIGNTK